MASHSSMLLVFLRFAPVSQAREETVAWKIVEVIWSNGGFLIASARLRYNWTCFASHPSNAPSRKRIWLQIEKSGEKGAHARILYKFAGEQVSREIVSLFRFFE